MHSPFTSPRHPTCSTSMLRHTQNSPACLGEDAIHWLWYTSAGRSSKLRLYGAPPARRRRHLLLPPPLPVLRGTSKGGFPAPPLLEPPKCPFAFAGAFFNFSVSSKELDCGHQSEPKFGVNQSLHASSTLRLHGVSLAAKAAQLCSARAPFTVGPFVRALKLPGPRPALISRDHPAHRTYTTCSYQQVHNLEEGPKPWQIDPQSECHERTVWALDKGSGPNSELTWERPSFTFPSLFPCSCLRLNPSWSPASRLR